MKVADYLVFFVLIGFILCACNRKMSEKTENKEPLGSIAKAASLAEEKYDEATVWPNSNNLFAIAISTHKAVPRSMIENAHFFVYDVSVDSIILEDIIPLGMVQWLDTYKIEVKKYPGEVDEAVIPDMGYTYDVQLREKSKL